MQIKQVSHRLGKVDGSHQTMILRQRQPPMNRQANALEWVITKIVQDTIDKIRADWASMKLDWVGAEWQQSEGIIMNLI